MTKVSKDFASKVSEEVERQPQSHTNYGYSSQSSLDPGAKIMSVNKQQTPSPNNNHKDPKLWRDLTAYWILGLCNNYGYVIMLSAAHDIIEKFNTDNGNHNETVTIDSGRQCNIISTGAILLADIIPSMVAKFTAPFLPFWVHVRVSVAILLAIAGFILVPFANYSWIALLGVVFTSFGCGLGETTFLAYSSFYNKNVVSTWSSGTGGAGVIGSFSYAALSAILGPEKTILIMLVIPFIEAASFWILLRRPKESILSGDESQASSSSSETVDDGKPIDTLKDQFIYIVKLMKYMIPLSLVYLFEYFINQGLYELIFFENTIMTKAEQYRWLNFDYQVGVFISRSSVNLFTIDKIYLMSIFQFINVVYFVTEVLFYITPNIWIVFAIAFWEGLLGGGAYVNTFYRMSKEIPQSKRLFALGVVAQADSYGIALSGILSLPVHNAICKLPKPTRSVIF